MSLAESRSPSRLDIGQSLQEILNTFARNIGPLALMGLVLGYAPAALVDLGRALGGNDGGYFLLVALGGVASLIARPILAGAVIYMTLRDLDGTPATLAECISAGRRRWGTLLGLTIWSGLLIGLGFIFLVVPGVILALRWCVAGPLVVLGGRTIRDTMQRSATLTAGRRWAIFLLGLTVCIGLVVLAVLLGLLQEALTPIAGKVWAGVLTNPLANVSFDLTFPITAAVIFRQLRDHSEGVRTEALAEVFA